MSHNETFCSIKCRESDYLKNCQLLKKSCTLWSSSIVQLHSIGSLDFSRNIVLFLLPQVFESSSRIHMFTECVVQLYSK